MAKKKMEIYGGVVVSGKQYIDDDIAKLLDVSFRSWKVAGDLTKEEGNILVIIGRKRRVFDGQNFLPEALTYIKESKSC